MSTIKCQCCKAISAPPLSFDAILGIVCLDCAKGAQDGYEELAKLGVVGIYTGICGDNLRKESA